MITVRLATPDDAEAIARQTSMIQQLHQDALPLIFKPPSAELFPPMKLAALIQDPYCIVAVAEVRDKIVGHIYGSVVNHAENEFNQAHAYVYIHQIGVDENTRGKGAGTALISFMRDQARELGLTDMRVNHWAFNTHARGFFEACGFSPIKIMLRQALEDADHTKTAVWSKM